MQSSRRTLIAGGSAAILSALSAPALAAAPRRFDIARYGAIPDGRTVNTAAIQRTIDACAAAGGGTVVVPAGVFLSGSVWMKPGVDLELQKDAVLKGSANLDDYPLTLRRFVETWPEALRMALINAHRCHGLRITGPGTLDGNGDPVWHRFFDRPFAQVAGTEVKYHFPQLVFIRDSNDVHIAGVTFRDAAFWNVHLYRCRKILIEDCRFEVPHKVRAPSSDGTDLDSCQDVTIRRCFYSVDDDSIVFKGTQGARALQFTEAPPVERVHIHDCVFDAGLGAIVFGTNATTVRDIRVENCDCSGDQPMVRLKLRPDTPGQRYERIHVRGMRLHERPAGIWHGGEIFYGAPPPLGPDQGSGPVDGVIAVVSPDHGPDMPPRLPGDVVRDLTIEKVTGTTRGFGDISAHPAIAVSNITLRDIDVRLTDPELAPLVAKGVENLKLERVRVNGGPPTVIR